MTTIFPKNYYPLLNSFQTEIAIRKIKQEFEKNLTYDLDLLRITAPLFVESGYGLNDDLNGIEVPVHFPVKGMNNSVVEVVHSLAKWKRLQLHELKIPVGEGIVTDMNAIRPMEDLDNIHSIYVDQWDWEKTISKENRTLEYLKSVVKKIYHTIYKTEEYICNEYSQLKRRLPKDITFLHTEDMEKEYPNLSPKEREHTVAKKYGAVCVIGIGYPLPISKVTHDGRSPDYDDWSSLTKEGYHGLNCDIIVWNDVLQQSLELSSMGIRVDSTALKRQLEMRNATDREKFMFHQMLLKGELPLSIGGGIGQSRLCMFYLQKAHIGEIQASVWNHETKEQLAQHNIFLL
ncbi:aspartate--ammonia ligase, putative [Entamoeba dispar SAW760]|uniref:Aspartate--ammonia ligase, putative n=1 Tax=Entamoeba dispar (strain ATCC PRA-260 / SAW760) TaxID=370354 RepID=B0EL18_ENTDS|nr:aspartate--ammonia ligase, putative [Entamoeba dispar SAW760]EDR24780.1 aspartate--ammonia ligase, putative [Entamoeba dispar SAW760]|eukprot:EDR24780.1 aspartate--ammonia ligase, putative [Entamoeba dispar SAW760]